MKKQTRRSHMESEASQNSIHVLPAELVIEILSRLPVKSLLKFRCASKSWLALISSPEFIKKHLISNVHNKEYTHHKVLLSATPNYSFRDCSFSSLFNDSVIETKDLDYPRQVPCGVSIGSVNGLICLFSRKKELFLWNPSIKKYKKLSDPKTTLGYHFNQLYGFGYDMFHDDYNVIVIFIDISLQIEEQKYSLKSDSWRRVDNCPSLVPRKQSGKFVNGKLHWATITGPDVCVKRNIISIDLADEKWSEMEQPCYPEGVIISSLGVLGSDLSVLLCKCEETFMLDVWVMKEYGVKESWMKMFTFENPENQLLSGYFGLRCLHMTNGSEILVVFGSTFMIYNSKDNSLRYPKVINAKNWDEAEIYIESLVCPFSTVGTEDATKMRLKAQIE